MRTWWQPIPPVWYLLKPDTTDPLYDLSGPRQLMIQACGPYTRVRIEVVTTSQCLAVTVEAGRFADLAARHKNDRGLVPAQVTLAEFAITANDRDAFFATLWLDMAAKINAHGGL